VTAALERFVARTYPPGYGPTLEKGVGPKMSPREYIAHAKSHGMTTDQAKRQYRRQLSAEWWGSEKYTVCHYRDGAHGFDPTWTLHHLSIHRRDRAPCTDWREFQLIKTTVLGDDAEAVQLYPAEDRVVDGANEYHLWSLFDGDGKALRWPLGFNDGRMVTNSPGPGAVQRPLGQTEGMT
jgi:hypothetical protein